MMDQVYTTLVERAREVYQQHQTKQSKRVVIALAGPPGSGKSTVAAEVVQRLTTGNSAAPVAIVLPMDGFHLSRATLEGLPNRDEAFTRRGAQWTYDADGVVKLVKNLTRSDGDVSQPIYAPSFDHATKDPVQAAITIHSQVDLIILEGNWLLLDEHPWSIISQLVDDTWFIDVDKDLALQRIAKRHLLSGIESSMDRAISRAQINDIPNGDLVRSKLIPPMVWVESVEVQA